MPTIETRNERCAACNLCVLACSFHHEKAFGRRGASIDILKNEREGEVEIVKVIDGVEQVLGTVGQGGIFGEMALIDAKPRMAAARAARGTTIICVSQQMFDDKLKKSDPFIRGLLNILADNVRSLSNK